MNDMHLKKDKLGWIIVNCPYDSIIVKLGCTLIHTTKLKEMILNIRAFPCQGESCVMYPCERVQKFADGEE